MGIAHSATMASQLARGLQRQADEAEGIAPPPVVVAPLSIAVRRCLAEATKSRAEFEDSLLAILAPHRAAFAEVSSWLFPEKAARNSRWRERHYDALAQVAALEHAIPACDVERDYLTPAPEAAPEAPEAPPC